MFSFGGCWCFVVVDFVEGYVLSEVGLGRCQLLFGMEAELRGAVFLLGCDVLLEAVAQDFIGVYFYAIGALGVVVTD